VESVSEKYCGIYCIDRIENVDKYKSVSCLYHLDKIQILVFICPKGIIADLTFKILVH